MWGDNTYDQLDSASVDLTFWNGTVDGEDCVFALSKDGDPTYVIPMNCNARSRTFYIQTQNDYTVIPLCIDRVQNQNSSTTVVETLCY